VRFLERGREREREIFRESGRESVIFLEREREGEREREREKEMMGDARQTQTQTQRETFRVSEREVMIPYAQIRGDPHPTPSDGSEAHWGRLGSVRRGS